MKKGQVKGTDSREEALPSFSHQPALVGCLAGHRAQQSTSRAAGPRQPSMQPGWAAKRGLPGAAAWGPCRHGAQPPGRGIPREWLQGDCTLCKEGPGMPLPPPRPCGPTAQGGPAARVDSRLLLQLPGWAEKYRSAHTHIPVQALLHSITALSSIN